MRKRRTGFTLIELLVVITIIGILAAIILVSVSGARTKALDAKRIADIRDIQSALELYANDNGYLYPVTLGLLVPTYMSQLPTDPSSSGTCVTGTEASCYRYAAIGVGLCAYGATGYHLGAVLQNAGNSALLSDADSAKSSGICTGSQTDFYGTSAGCTGVAGVAQGQPGATETCYDVHS